MTSRKIALYIPGRRLLFLLTALSVGGCQNVAPQSREIYAELPVDRAGMKILFVWESHCGYCRDMFPWVNELRESIPSRRVSIYGISLDDDPGEAADFAREMKANFPQVVGPKVPTILAPWKIFSVPELLVFDREGRLRFRHAGFSPGQLNLRRAEIIALRHAS